MLITILLFSFIPFLYSQGKNDSLLSAIEKNDTTLIDYCIKKGADVNFITQQRWVNISPLITAINNNHIEAAKMLLQNNADINWKDTFNSTALMYAASIGNIKMVQLLIDNGADLEHKDKQGNNAISAAKEGNHNDIVKLLKTKIKLSKQSFR